MDNHAAQDDLHHICTVVAVFFISFGERYIHTRANTNANADTKTNTNANTTTSNENRF